MGMFFRTPRLPASIASTEHNELQYYYIMHNVIIILCIINYNKKPQSPPRHDAKTGGKPARLTESPNPGL